MELESEKKRNGAANQTPRKSPKERESRPHFPRVYLDHMQKKIL